MSDFESEVTCDEHGRFECAMADPLIRPLSVELKVAADNRYRAAFATRELLPGASSLDVSLSRVCNGAIEGWTLDDRDDPVAGAHIRFDGAGPDGRDLEVVSDGEGRFAAGPLLRDARPFVEREGYTVFEISPILREPGGGWRSLRIRLARLASMKLTVRDEKGRPQSDMGVEIDPSPNEPLSEPGKSGWLATSRRRGTTGPNGIARFDDLWAGKRLRIRLLVSGSLLTTDRMNAGEALLHAGPIDGDAIVASSDRMLELTVTLDRARHLRGVVTYEDGTCVRGASVLVSQIRPDPSGRQDVNQNATADERGEFVVPIADLDRRGVLHVAATMRRQVALITGQPEQPVEYGGGLDVDAAEYCRASEPPMLKVVMQPLESIAGHLMTSDGAPVVGYVSAVQSGSPSSTAPTQLGRRAGGWSGSDGTFEIVNLPPGTYDVFATVELGLGATERTCSAYVPGVPSGTRNVAVVIARGEHVTVRLDLRGPGRGPIGHHQLMIGRMHDNDSANRGKVPESRSMTFDDLSTWPLRAPLWLIGRSPQSDGSSSSLYTIVDRPQNEPIELQPGFYSIGIEAWEGNQCEYFPVATQGLLFESGEYALHFDLVPACRVEGRVTGIRDCSQTDVALVDEHGDLIPLPPETSSSGRATLYRSVRQDGRFVLPVAPCGRFRLRIGRARRLIAKQWDGEASITTSAPITRLSIEAR